MNLLNWIRAFFFTFLKFFCQLIFFRLSLSLYHHSSFLIIFSFYINLCVCSQRYIELDWRYIKKEDTSTTVLHTAQSFVWDACVALSARSLLLLLEGGRSWLSTFSPSILYIATTHNKFNSPPSSHFFHLFLFLFLPLFIFLHFLLV